MKWNYSLGLIAALSVATLQTVSAATNFWQDANTSFQAKSVGDASSLNVSVNKGRRLTASLGEMKFGFASGGVVILSLPLPDGTMTDYQFSRSSIMPDELAVKYPDIQTFKAFDINNPANRGSFDITPQGFHGMFKHNGKWVFIDPENRNDNGNYVAYYGIDAQPLESHQADEVIPGLISTDVIDKSIFSSRPLVGTTLRTYRIAIAAAAEYTIFHGGKTQALAAINTLLSRVNEVYERDLSIRFELVANNDDIIYLNPRTDPYSNNIGDARRNDSSLLTVLSDDDFDIGHVLNTSEGGVAQIAGVCRSGSKSFGMTGRANPTTDAFYIDFVAHELGHQLGANHTFNGTFENCSGGTRTEATAWEPGSGSTIMGYAGICGEQNLQSNSDPYFHTGSIQQILETVNAAGCGAVTVIQNKIPIADAGADVTIPANMPFKLTGSGSDEDGDTLSYVWEQYDTGESSSGISTMVDDGTRPLFRSWEPTANPVRFLPNLADFSSGTLTIGETMPTVARDLNFRLTVRDGKGGVATDEMIVKIVAAQSSFKITAPSSGADLQPGVATVVTWEVDSSLSGCSTVDISMSENGNDNFDVILADGTANDGEFGFTVSTTVTADSVLMVSCAESGLLALSPGELTATVTRTPTAITPATTTETSDDSGGGSFSNGVFLYWLLGLLGFIRLFKPTKAVSSNESEVLPINNNQI